MLSPNLNQQQKRQLSNYRGGIQVPLINSGGHALHHLSNSPLLLRSGFKGVEQTPSPNPNRMSFSLKWNGFLNQNQNTSQMSFGGILGGNTAGGNGSTNRGLNYLKHIKHQRSLSNSSNLQFKHLTPPLSQQQNGNGLQSEQQQNRSGRHDTLPSNEKKGNHQQDSVIQEQVNSLKIVIPDYNQCPVEISLKESERSHSNQVSLQHTIQTPQTSSPSNLLLPKPQLQNQKKKSMFYKEDKNRSANTRNVRGLAQKEEVKREEGEHLSQDSFEEDAQLKDNVQQQRELSSNESQGKKKKYSAESKLDDLRNSDDPDISKEDIVKPLNLENPIFPKKFESVSVPNKISGEQAIKKEPDLLNINSRSVKNKRNQSGGSIISSDEQPSLIPIERSFYKYSEYNYLKSMGKDPLQGVTSFNAQSGKNQDMTGITTTMNNQQVGGGGLISNYLIGNKDTVQQLQKYGLGVNDALNGKRMSGSRPGVGPNQNIHTAQNLQNNVSHFTFRQGQGVIQTSEGVQAVVQIHQMLKKVCWLSSQADTSKRGLSPLHSTVSLSSRRSI
ncbi:hypothetical protein FGO68_gene13833 [Halteria grandinella]|uniref:Uncharacterized protein n=1 Tax=Halteria grandinella TaxID=5974 RepID=A0A8J8TAF7_HALGN|nr:hypothetical protein FGO68_gene13833 [Halteria grandinella]